MGQGGPGSGDIRLPKQGVGIGWAHQNVIYETAARRRVMEKGTAWAAGRRLTTGWHDKIQHRKWNWAAWLRLRFLPFSIFTPVQSPCPSNLGTPPCSRHGKRLQESHHDKIGKQTRATPEALRTARCLRAESLTPDVEHEGGDGAGEGEDDEDAAGGGVAADEVARPVLHVGVHRGLRE